MGAGRQLGNFLIGTFFGSWGGNGVGIRVSGEFLEGDVVLRGCNLGAVGDKNFSAWVDGCARIGQQFLVRDG